MLKKLSKLVLLGIFLSPSFAQADSSDFSSEIEALKQRIAELEAKQIESEQKTEVLAEEVEENREKSFIPQKAELKSQWGLGPAASSVYNVKQGLSIGSYGEMTYRNLVNNKGDNKDQVDFLRLVAYLGYKFNDWIIFNSEIELEHGSTSSIGGESGDKDGSVSVELAYLDFMLNDAANARVGMLLVPMGFINELHESPYFHGVVRPEVEQRLIPSTWRENGFGLFGNLSEEVAYRTYLMNGLRAARFSDSGIRGGRQKGNRALAEDVAWTGRLDYTPNDIAGLLLGGSFWWGNSGQDEDFGGETPSVMTTIFDLHAQYHFRQLELRALGVYTMIDDTEVLNDALGTVVGEEQYGWYAEAAYNVLPLFGGSPTQYLAPFLRYENFDTQASVAQGFESNPVFNKEVYTLGLTYKPIPQVVLKADYRNIDNSGGDVSADEVAFGMGYAF